MLWGETKLGKIGETIPEKWPKTAVFGQKTGKNDGFSKSRFASDSVIRWFESSYPSHFESSYHILIAVFLFSLENSFHYENKYQKG